MSQVENTDVMDSVDPIHRGASSKSSFVKTNADGDPYNYQVGFGNRFASEAVPGTLPQAQNAPQKTKYDLYPEQLNGTTFVSTRAETQHAWLYRIFPSVAHGETRKAKGNPDLESTFLSSNGSVEFVPRSLCWLPFPLPSKGSSVDFVQGLKTIAGHGDPTAGEGLAIHIYAANASMGNRAFCNNDGDLLILPQEGRLDIQTEFGRMLVKVGELAVVQAGIRFKVDLPDGRGRGYIQEVFGSHYELPELGPLGSNGMALHRDFCYPLASFDLDLSPWEVIYKVAGRLWSSQQNHTPFDVVAWHGNYVPYKYGLKNFINAGVIDRDQSDPTISTILLAKSSSTGRPLTELMAFTPKWSVAMNSFRPPYYHRNMAAEIMGVISGQYAGSSKDLRAGGLSFQPSYMPHGETHSRYLEATTRKLEVQRVGEGSLVFMFHVSAPCSITRFALERSAVLKSSQAEIWDDMEGHFFDHLAEVNHDLRRNGLPALETASVVRRGGDRLH